MKIKIYIIFVICIVSNSLFTNAQCIKINNGIVISSINHDKMPVLNNNETSYAGSIGIDYLNHKYFFLSSEAGYSATGGHDYILTLDVNGDRHAKTKLKAHNLFINTTFNGKLPIFKNSFFLFADTGIQVDYMLKKDFYVDGIKISETPYDIDISRLYICIPFKAGVYYDFNRIRIGTYYSYLLNVNKRNNMTKRQQIITFSIGYLL